MLLKLSLTIAIIGTFLLLLLSNFLHPKQINSYSELKLNSYVTTTGKIISIKNFDDFSIIKLDNNITLTCNNCKFQINHTIRAQGKVTEYQFQLQINAEKITSS